tara:strand:+ start:273 stop:1223 length:951 start_codon:yes stop_codon:yes gene_type:complete
MLWPTSRQTDSAGTPPDADLQIHAAREVADVLPDILVAAERIANTIALGLHGRRKSGPGEDFWQFRPYTYGEPATRIDWRRSANQEELQIREREWEAAHTVWLWPDLTGSMAYCSHLSDTAKRDRALLLTLALAIVLTRSGERVGLLGTMPARADRKAAEAIANILGTLKDPTALPVGAAPKRFTDVVVFSDFLDSVEDVSAGIARLSALGARGHLVQINDPIEESFPFTGRVQFSEAESGLKLTAGRAEVYRAAYQARLAERRSRLQAFCRKMGWTFAIHHTDRPVSEALMALYTRLTDDGTADALPSEQIGGAI